MAIASSIELPKIELVDPATLRVHADLKHQPGAWEEDDPRLKALCDDIAIRGIDQPLLVTEDNAIADGRNRFKAARLRQLSAVPIRRVPAKDVPLIIVHSLLQRRHYTRGQLAYLLVPHIQEAFEEAAKRQTAGLKHGAVANSVRHGANPVAEWAGRIGVSTRYLQQAQELYEYFKDETKRDLTDKTGDKPKAHKGVTFREFYEPRLLDHDKPMGLGAAIAGIGSILEAEAKGKSGKGHKGGKPDDTADQLRLFNEVVEDEFKRWDYWTAFDDETKKEHFQAVRAKAADIDADQLEAMAAYHRRLAAEFEKAAREAKAATADHN